jgi:hypothetical protein
VDSLRKFPIKEFLTGGGQSKDPHAWRSGMSGFPGHSLLGVLPGKRTCEDAGVDKGEQYCYVSHRLKAPFKPIKASKWFVSQLGAHLESSMNNKTIQYRAKCKEFKFRDVLLIRSREDKRSDGKYDYDLLYT